MKHFLLICFGLAFVLTSCGPAKTTGNDLAVNNPIETSIDLTKVQDDKVPVMINPGRISMDTVVFRLPRVVQGTYAISDFGSFIEDFQALDYNGEELRSKKIDTNTWVIYEASNLEKINYWVNDTFDIESSGQATPFSPSGTNIEEDNYVLNLHGFIGYFDSLKSNSYVLDVTAAAEFDRTSALQMVEEVISEDGKVVTTRYQATRYFDITDNPMMYGKLDVEEFMVGDINIVLSVYSPNKIHSATSLKETMFKMMEAQKNYLGDLNSTKRYDIYVYLAGKNAGAPTGFGALEHHTSTVVVMPESMPKESLERQLIDIVSHEFFHILSPLSVHSEDVHYFDYNQPTFSKHLWMYEGLTEYFANIFQIDQGLISEEEFYNKMMSKINTAASLDDTMSFTEMSENILEQPYARNYFNVYQKGALIGMCLDIILREESNGEVGILSVMKELSVKYGTDQPFEDDKIIDEIVNMTYPSIGKFFEDHIIGGTPIDYSIYFEKVGLGINESKVETNYVQNAGRMIVRGDREAGSVMFNEEVVNNSFWNEAGVKPNDIIKSIDGVVVTMENANSVFGEVFGWQPGRDISVTLIRDGEEMLIEETLTTSYTMGQQLGRNPDISDAQKDLLKKWLKG
ncbi:peptidase M61 [Lutimonas zeaxanthinifaciens]|uniref:M61 family metallopeptidase n=1 Tax=Lutimonas zeaxanthinifaciens TaxID=3060215 RepID=UPI00265CE4E7|nr:peptidase M61 [Lutimonas sp. YSD2104]WKK66384.1 peptidase M61 [Lutimonas sp. YSD2104]